MNTLTSLAFIVEFDRKMDGRWVAAVKALPGCLAYGRTQVEALHAVLVLTGDIFAGLEENGEACPRDMEPG